MFVSPSLICRSAELGTVHKSTLQGSAAGAGASTFFVPKSRKGCAPPVCFCSLGRNLSPCVFPQGLAYAELLCSIFIPPGSRFFSPGSQRHSRLFWAEGSGCSHYLARLTHMQSTSGKRCDEPFTHLCFACLLLSKFQNSECFKN